MRALFVANFRLAAALDEPLQHPIDVWPAHAASELAIAESAGAPLAKQVIVLAVERPSTVKRFDGRHPLLHRLTPF